MKTKTKNTGIRAKQKFYDYCVKVGIDLRYLDVHNLQIGEIPPKRKSSFKNRSAQVKQKHNYRFKLDHTSDNLLASYPNIELITFERKTA
jgi:hypothetical protein